MSNKVELKGKCLCGAVKYKLSEKPLFTQACHCKDCKILTGSSYVINSSVLENTLSIEGEISSTIKLKLVVVSQLKYFSVTNVGLIFIQIMSLRSVD
jgi:hypothetical protein